MYQVLKFFAILALAGLTHSAHAQSRGTQTAQEIIVKRVNPLFPQFLRFDQSKGDFIVFLQTENVLTDADAIPINNDIRRLPAPPDADLLSTLQSLADPPVLSPPLYLTWLSHKNIGGVYFTAGSGDCQSWTMFELRGKNSSPADVPAFFEPNVCGKDGYDSAIGYIGGDAVAILTATYPDAAGNEIVHLSLAVWEGEYWGASSDTSLKILATDLSAGRHINHCPTEDGFIVC